MSGDDARRRTRLPLIWCDDGVDDDWRWPERPDSSKPIHADDEVRLSWWVIGALVGAMAWTVGLVAVKEWLW